MPANEPQPNKKKTLKICTLLETFSIVSALYAVVVLVASLSLGSTACPSYHIAFWSLATASTWLSIMLGLLSAQGHGTYVRAWRFVLFFVILLQVPGAVALLPEIFCMYSLYMVLLLY